jgi:hypothetical protein
VAPRARALWWLAAGLVVTVALAALLYRAR